MGYYIEKGALQPAAQAVTLELAKANSNIETSHNDALLKLKLSAAHAEAENYIGRLIAPRAITLGFDSWSDIGKLPIGPLSGIEITYRDPAGDVQTLATSNYRVHQEGNQMEQKIEFTATELPEVIGERYPITVSATGGMMDPPADIREAILLIFSASELYREDMPLKINRASRAKLRPYRILYDGK